MIEPEDAARFVEAMRAEFAAQRTGADDRPFVGVSGGVARDGSAVIVYYHWDGGPLVGQRWVMEELARLFDPHDPQTLAEAMFVNEVEDPDNWCRRLDVDWANGLVEDPSALVWRGEGRGP